MTSKEIEDLLKKTVLNPCMPDYTEFNGYILGYKYNEIKDEIDNFEVKDTDIWITTFPKAGTTWTQEMVWLIMNNLNYEDAKRPLPSRSPFIEMAMMFNWDSLKKLKGVVMPSFYTDSIEYAKSVSNPRCIKCHLAWDLLPKAIRDKQKRPKIIHVVREPKDVCVSYYYHHKLLQYYTGNFEEFCTLFLNEKLYNSPYWKVVESYWKQRKEPNVLIIKYEDMKRDLKSVVTKVAKFLGKTVPVNKMDELLDHLSFESMQNNPAINIQPMEADNKDPNAQFIRKGIIGDHKNLMSHEIIDKFDKWIEKNNTIGLTF